MHADGNEITSKSIEAIKVCGITYSDNEELAYENQLGITKYLSCVTLDFTISQMFTSCAIKKISVLFFLDFSDIWTEG